MYKVVSRFADLQDKNFIYEVGDVYPRDGVDVSDERIKELASTANKTGKALIEKIAKSIKAEVEPEPEKEVEAEVETETEVEPEEEAKPKKKKN